MSVSLVCMSFSFVELILVLFLVGGRYRPPLTPLRINATYRFNHGQIHQTYRIFLSLYKREFRVWVDFAQQKSQFQD